MRKKMVKTNLAFLDPKMIIEDLFELAISVISRENAANFRKINWCVLIAVVKVRPPPGISTAIVSYKLI